MNKYIHNFDTTYEPCSECGCEVQITTDGKSSCLECGKKAMLPCSICKLAEKDKCDWNEQTRCTAFPERTKDELIDKYGYWGAHPDHLLEDWLYEVRNSDTRFGYWEWVIERMVD